MSSAGGARPLKRQREDTDDGGTTGGPPAAKRGTTAHAVASSDLEDWNAAVQSLQTARIPIPPPRVLEQCRAHYQSFLAEYDRALDTLHRAEQRLTLFEQQAAGDGTPRVISDALKIPNVQVFRDAVNVELNEIVAAARAKAEADLAIVHKSAIAYVRAKYTAQVAVYRDGVNVAQRADAFEVCLQAYAQGIIESAPGGGEIQKWNAAISRLRAAIYETMSNHGYDFAEKLREDTARKDAKATAVATARAKAETEEAAKPVGELIKEQVDERLVELEKQVKSLAASHTPATAPPAATSSSTTPRPNGKPQPAPHKSQRGSGSGGGKPPAKNGNGAVADSKKTPKAGKAKRQTQGRQKTTTR
ncbi:hypothetical protein MIND_01412200 [Mycena indigotica]|uniref:Uncharacterized protein n=1 Tax=Mycena indigotica TaxID=2126181 RepID=A0A8H6RZ01_9AGAR|nr:uncharacterized protein MIND_01412200 [Mycena indigotica]KAF7288956.1 hypothetical protein MIND_01412200 [Mycena indigotica]